MKDEEAVLVSIARQLFATRCNSHELISMCIKAKRSAEFLSDQSAATVEWVPLTKRSEVQSVRVLGQR